LLDRRRNEVVGAKFRVSVNQGQKLIIPKTTKRESSKNLVAFC